MDNIYALHNDLKNKTYTHSNYQAFKINDPKPRDIHKAEVRDRLLHHAIYRILYPYFDQKFIYDSYSCRIGKGTHKAIYRFESFIQKVSQNNTKTCWVLKCDIKKFFANIDHQILKKILEKHIQDKDILWLFSQTIDSFKISTMHSVRQDLAENTYMRDSVNVPSDTNSTGAENMSFNKIYAIAEIGLPLGNLTSQLLVNIYMNEFDQFVKHKLKVKYYIRYADDFVILSQDRKYLEKILEQMQEFLKINLKLTMNPNKVFIKTIASGVDFLGWVHFPKHRVLRTSTKKRMLRNLKKNQKLNTVVSYLGMLSHGNGYKLKEKINSPILPKREFGIGQKSEGSMVVGRREGWHHN